MRVARPLAALAIALGVAGGLTGCDAVQDAANTANQVGQGIDKAKACADAVGLLAWTPDMSDPQKALEETKAKAEELQKLAAASPDQQVKSALDEAAKGMGNVQSAADWVQQKADLVQKVSEACGS
ncbi:hypothetical protein Lesp02_25660 [Lentzea sp. NBRC 105346]|uniref:bacteriophage spanin2 family protein n=1 Tax=Lentzea sp. NBRC 105346 TaxID=3032205 RepID=UPI002555E9DB|nr:bacteriophage spanin2 family protein [Lentzea sp. NBRC 105346]GLZ30377.1 hypothetical protein Lesp02_25660 [Lentzea sp. NBRC 105346]